MKLSDIDLITEAKSQYRTYHAQLTGMKQHRCSSLQFYNIGDVLQFYNIGDVSDTEVLEACRAAVINHYEKKLEEFKTKLMMFGVTDFEGLD